MLCSSVEAKKSFITTKFKDLEDQSKSAAQGHLGTNILGVKIKVKITN